LLAVVMIMIIVKYCSMPKLVSSLGLNFIPEISPLTTTICCYWGSPSWVAEMLSLIQFHHIVGLVWFGLVGAANCLESIFMEFSLQCD
jgi:hypothetical protein